MVISQNLDRKNSFVICAVVYHCMCVSMQMYMYVCINVPVQYMFKAATSVHDSHCRSGWANSLTCELQLNVAEEPEQEQMNEVFWLPNIKETKRSSGMCRKHVL